MENSTIFLIHIISLALLTYCIFNIHNFIKLKKTVKKLKNSEEYIQNLETLHDDVRCFKHDFDNIITTIGGYISANDLKGLKNYYSNLECECKNVNNLYMLSPEVVNDPGIYNLLINKYRKAKDLNIKISVEFLLDFKKLKMNIYEFSRILGILLDNSIEAAKDSFERLINISFRNEIIHHQQLVVIENSYNNKNVNIDSIFEKSKTDKENHSGLGLYEVRKILKKHNNLNLFTSKNDKFFIQQLEIYY